MKLFFNAKFYSLRNEAEYFKAITVKDGRIDGVFHETPSIPNAQKIDLKGHFVYPGFIDTHTHSFSGGLYSMGTSLRGVTCLNDLFSKLREAPKFNDKIIAYQFDESKILEGRFPTLAELDKVLPDTPAIIRRIDGHSSIINSSALSQIKFDQILPTNFSGVFKGKLNSYVSSCFLDNQDEEGICEAYRKAAQIAIEGGHTTVHTMVGDAELDPEHLDSISNILDRFDVDFVLYPQIVSPQMAKELGSNRIGGCILADGSFGSHTAALTEPYNDIPGYSGLLYQSDEYWKNLIQKAHELDLQVAIHAIGDAAIMQILDIYHQVQMSDPKDLCHQIIHCELTTDAILSKIKSANVTCVMQPMFDRLWANPEGLYETRLGQRRTKMTTRLNSMLQHGILVTGGSDWTVTEFNALAGINACLNIFNPSERITPYQALELYTKNAAKLNFDEERIGMILPGMDADLVCLNQDLLGSIPVRPNKAKVMGVIKKGKFALDLIGLKN